MEASRIQSDSRAVVSQIIWLWVSRHLSVHMIHGSSQGLMLVISVSKCRGIDWCSNILLLYQLPGKVLGQPHLWCGVCIWIHGFSRAQKFTHPPRLRQNLKMVKMSLTFIPFAKRTSWTGVPSSHTLGAVEKEIRAWIVLGWDENICLPWIVGFRFKSTWSSVAPVPWSLLVAGDASSNHWRWSKQGHSEYRTGPW